MAPHVSVSRFASATSLSAIPNLLWVPAVRTCLWWPLPCVVGVHLCYMQENAYHTPWPGSRRSISSTPWNTSPHSCRGYRLVRCRERTPAPSHAMHAYQSTVTCTPSRTASSNSARAAKFGVNSTSRDASMSGNSCSTWRSSPGDTHLLLRGQVSPHCSSASTAR